MLLLLLLVLLLLYRILIPCLLLLVSLLLFHLLFLFLLLSHLGLDRAQLIRCGGGDYIAAQREQWNDGSNTLCVAPGVVVVYDRNNVTNQILRESGITVLELPSSELSRGRGGPRCMSMPLCREDL